MSIHNAAVAANKNQDQSQPYYLIDGSGFIYRAFHALPPLTRADGTPVGAVLGFCNILLRLITEQKAENILVLFDAGRKTFRNDLYANYKANRAETPPDLIPQFPLLRSAVQAFGIPGIAAENYEADDLIAAYAEALVQAGKRVVIVSADKDMLQLLRAGIEIFDPMRQQLMGAEAALEKFGVEPERVVDVQALAGDSSDNVPGVPGIGLKTAALLINQFGSLDALLARADEIPQPKRRDSLQQHAEMARLSRQLVTLCKACPLPVPLADLSPLSPQADILLAFIEAQGFKSLRTRLLAWLETRGQTAKFLPQASAADLVTQTLSPSASVVDLGAAAAAIINAPRNYEIITSAEALSEFLKGAEETGLLAIDTETDGLVPSVANIIGFSLATAAGIAAYVPLAHLEQASAAQGQKNNVSSNGADDLFAPQKRSGQLEAQAAFNILRPVLQNPSILKLGHNIKFDMQVLAQHDLPLSPYDDTMLISSLLAEAADGHGLDALALQYLNYKKTSYSELTGTGKTRRPFAAIDLAAACDYAASDADDTFRLWQILKPRLISARQQTLYARHERPLPAVIASMETAGILVDTAHLAALSKVFAQKMQALEIAVYQLAGGEFNLGSPKQMAEILFGRLGLPSAGKGKAGGLSTGADVLEPLAEQGHVIAEKILAWRGYAKLKSTYTDALVAAVQPRTGRVHTSFNLVGAVTGRFSSTDPNLQNIPIRTEEGRLIRQAFVAAPGHLLISADYAQIELRILAHMAGVKALQAAFRDGLDIHKATAAEMFGLSLAAVTSEQRRQAKAINFGIIYGISAFGLARQLGCSGSEAQHFIRAYFARYPEIQDFMAQMKERARQQSYGETFYGRRIKVQGLQDKNAARRAYAERQAVNAPIQGTAADIIKLAMVRLPDALRAAGLSAKILLQVHDELLLEAKAEEAAATKECVCGVMRNAAPAEIPLTVAASAAPNWDAAH